MNLEIDTAADKAADMEAKRQCAIDHVWQSINWQHHPELLEMITQRQEFDDSFMRYLKGDFSHFNALCDEAKEFIVIQQAEKLLADQA